MDITSKTNIYELLSDYIDDPDKVAEVYDIRFRNRNES